MSLFKRFEKTPPIDMLRFDEQQLSNVNGQLTRLTERVQPDTSPRRVGLFNLLRFEGEYYDRTGGIVSGNDKRVRVWLGEATNPITNRAYAYNVAVIEDDWSGDDVKMTINLDTGSYDYDINGLHISQVARLAKAQLGPDAYSPIDISEDTVYRTFFYGLSDAGSSEMYRDTGAPK